MTKIAPSMTDAPTTRRIKITDPVLVRHLVPGGTSYDYVVTDRDFDEYDNEAPGTYRGIEVPADVADRWDRGLKECARLEIQPRSAEGIGMRYRVTHGEGARIPGQLHRWLADQAREIADKAVAAAETAVSLATYEETLDGYTDVGADTYSGQWWPLDRRAELEVVAEHRDVPMRWRKVLRLPNGDLLEILAGQSWCRWTTDQDIIQEAERRLTIIGHRYTPTLLRSLIELESAGALRLPCYTWFGGVPVVHDDGCVDTYAGSRALSGPEKTVRLREHLKECIATHPKHHLPLRAALRAAIEGSVVAVES